MSSVPIRSLLPGERRKLTLVLADPREPLDLHRQCGRDTLRAIVQIPLQVRVGESHLFLVGLAEGLAAPRPPGTAVQRLLVATAAAAVAGCWLVALA